MATMSESPVSAHSVRERVLAATSFLSNIPAEISLLDEEDLIELTDLAEALGRKADALRVRVAGEVDARSGRDLEHSLARRHDCTSASNLLQLTTHVSPAEIRSRIALDRVTRSTVSMTGEPLPAQFPAVAEAFFAGTIGIDIAADLTQSLVRAAQKAVIDPVEAAAAERAIVEATVGGFTGDAPGSEALPATFNDYRTITRVWLEALTREGIEPTAEEQAKQRFLSIGRVGADGLARISGKLTPEAAGTLSRLFDAYLGSPVSFGSLPEDAEEDTPWSDSELVHDPRTVGQRRHDLLTSMMQGLAAADDAPTIGGSAPTLVVTVAADQLESPTGVADIDGVDIAVPVHTAHRIGCAGVVQKIVFDRRGRIVNIGSAQRLFTPSQCRAIAARDGGCIIPGCTVPAAWCEVHHVEEHAKGGATHTDNGVTLCWAHHHDIDHSGWQIEMRGGVPFVKAPRWIDRREIFRPVGTRRFLRERIRRRLRAAPPGHGLAA